MCGRFSLTATADDLRAFFGATELERHEPRYNIAPTQPIAMVRANPTAGARPGSNVPDRETVLVRWGLLPAWVKDPGDFPLLINGRSETVVGKASFKAAMRHRRTLVPASGFYEWRREGQQHPQAYWVRPREGGVVGFAGLMETWSGADGSEIDTGAILTTRANNALMHIHPRMPVVVRPADFERWLDCRTQEPRDVLDVFEPIGDDFFEAVPVSDKVNKVSNVGPDLQDPVEPTEQRQTAGRRSDRVETQMTLL